MRFAYADPPYFGYAKYYDHPEASVYDTLEGHHMLIERLCREFPDGWALSMTSGNLRDILPICPDSVRVMAWVKPFASFKPSVRVAYAWEPVVISGGRKRPAERDTVRDWLACPITLKRGLTGAKPEEFCRWIFEVLGMEPGDEFCDLFPGSGAVSRAYAAWHRQQRLPFPSENVSEAGK